MNRPQKTIAPAKAIARAIHDEIEALPTRDASSVDCIRRLYSALLSPEPPELVREVARELLSLLPTSSSAVGPPIAAGRYRGRVTTG
ncbi:MAG: hypothetical protein Kow0097_04020 [Candidatus Bipolaricaulota bacterium]|nr:hypothetical protein [Candidatus Bipolaricaulota bacterium]